MLGRHVYSTGFQKTIQAPSGAARFLRSRNQLTPRGNSHFIPLQPLLQPLPRTPIVRQCGGMALDG
jgi:hypothetical protein